MATGMGSVTFSIGIDCTTVGNDDVFSVELVRIAVGRGVDDVVEI